MNDAPKDKQSPEKDADFRRESHDENVGAIHAPIMRELAEPRDGYQHIPMWLIFIFFGLLAWGGWYLGTYSGGWDSMVYDESPSRQFGGEQQQTKQIDPVTLGKRVYTSCATCHQADGKGVQGNYPPLDGSGWVTGNPDTLIRLVLHGLEGPIEVKGELYDNVMPGWHDTLNNEQIAGVLTYIRQAWGNDAPAVESERVAEVRDRHSGRTAPWTADELMKLEGQSPTPAAAPATTPTQTQVTE